MLKSLRGMLYSMRQGFPSLRPLAGMSLSGSCAVCYWLGWGAWSAAGWLMLFAEYTFRVVEPPAAYLAEAWLAMLNWIIALVLADQVALKYYRATWQAFKQHNMAPELLSIERLSRVRSDLRRFPLLSLFAPPAAPDVGSQLYAAALWYQAISKPFDAPLWQRYSEWIVDIGAGFLPPATAGAAALLWPTRYGLATAALLTAVSLATLGYSAIRFAARRQAILDFFAAWR